MADILQQIMVHKRTEVTTARSRVAVAELERQIQTAPPVRDFKAALLRHHPMGLIAEVKRASPSAGLIRADFSATEIARTYVENGAACLSVLTDEKYFQGHLDYLRQIRETVDVPLLRKDFILDEYQILEARSVGADCILLIAECLDDAQLTDLYQAAVGLGMQALVELHDAANLERVLRLNPQLVGVNNRDLKVMKTNLQHCIDLRSRVPGDILFVGESGIHSRADVERLTTGDVHAMLVGETLMKSPDIGAKVRELLGR
ncbi:MAG: indole-3-glycerol phosphate synthase TrpC [Planctomycetota bacterium]|nr:MAG: indole-3-glycerol phosphate synthase TrpC [Planctomycetota bacterium]